MPDGVPGLTVGVLSGGWLGVPPGRGGVLPGVPEGVGETEGALSGDPEFDPEQPAASSATAATGISR
ncbi:hypothetical protein BWI15_12840 [Kribbella sp. ALI-6-A]|nr:hypothetical protein BWI15_12840 [Kribbella sp. ALI-6-A]